MTLIDSSLVELPVASKNDPRILERLVGPALPKRLTQEDEGAQLDDPGGDIDLAIEDNDVGCARLGRVDELKFDLRRYGRRVSPGPGSPSRLVAPGHARGGG